MAVLSKIRSRGKLVFIVILVALLGFIMNDFVTGSGSGLSSEDRHVGNIAGKSIDYKEFDNKVQQQAELYKERTQQATLTEDVMEQIRSQVWNDYQEELILLDAVKKSGVDVSVEELVDMIQGPNPHPQIIQNFTNPQTGQFNPADVTKYLQSLDDEKNADMKPQWILFEQGLKKDRMTTKYYNLIKKGLYATTLDAKHESRARGERADIVFVAKRYNVLSDSSVVYTEEDLRTYYNAHNQEPLFEQKEDTRSIEYVSYDVIPTPDDVEGIKSGLEKLKDQFAKTKDDTLFVTSYATTRNNIKYFTKNTIAPSLDTLVFGASKGTIVGPVLDAQTNQFVLAKVLDTKFGPDSVRARHILLKINNGDTLAAKTKADSLKNILKSGMPFEVLAKQFSQDPGSADKGGDLNWFTEGAMVKVFNDACFNGKKGDMPVVVSQFGVHLIEITDQTRALSKILLASIDKPIEPSQSTYEKAYNEASTFSINNKGEKFTEAANKAGLKVADDIKASDKTVRGLGEARSLVQWLYKAEMNETSEPFELDNKVVVAKLTKIKEKGTLPFDLVKEQIEAEVIKQKKGEKIASELAQASDIQSASRIWNAPVDTARGITFSAYSIPNVGAERKVLGSVFALPKNQLSKPIAGDYGVYVFSVLDKIDASQAQNVNDSKQFMMRNYAGRVDYEVYKVLQDIYGVEDSRHKFF